MAAKQQPKPLPEWFVKLAHFVPRFPGDGFNHTMTLPPKHGPFADCPCGASLYVTAWKHSPGDAELAICPQCSHWHSILFVGSPRVLGGEFIVTGRNQT